MTLISVTFLVSSGVKSRLVRPEQSANMLPIFVTFLVSDDKSRLVRPEQPENMEPISVTFCVFSGVKSRLVRPEQS